MTRPGFIEAGLKAVRETLVTAADKAGLTMRQYPVTRSGAQRFRGVVRRLETMLRRLLALMAANLDPEPARPAPQPPIPPAKTGAPSHPAEPSDTPVPTPRPRAFALTQPGGADPEQLHALRSRYGRRPAGDRWAETGTLLERYRTLLGHLDNPAPLARRMARHLARLKRSGAPCPICAPAPVPSRLGHELGLIATILPQAVGEALSDWYNNSS
ncbi:MAG: hypothetical protein RIB03_02020 [Henriciella sp.]|uniref:hypothetical protein n=1 Tax=Henriciella sp. TaxID=1968823 RepID=UPI0032EFA25A